VSFSAATIVQGEILINRVDLHNKVYATESGLYKTQTISSIRDVLYNSYREAAAALTVTLTNGGQKTVDYQWHSLPALIFVSTIPSSFFYLLNVNLDQLYV
jgi:hypothetical protein